MKAVMTTTLLPVTHYSVSLLQALQSIDDLEVVIYTVRDEENRGVPLKNIRLTWTDSFLYPLQIVAAVQRDKPDVVHLQHEINMYGGKAGAVLFPLLLLLLRLLGRRTVVTVHAVVDPKQVDADFAKTFAWNPGRLSVIATTAALVYIYRSIALLSSVIITHTPGLRRILITRYGAKPEKVHVVPIGIAEPASDQGRVEPSRFDLQDRQAFILCFGYIVRRKGLEHLLEAFKATHLRFPACKLILAGGARDPGYLAELQDWVRHNELDRHVAFSGLIDEAEISWLFSHARLAVFTYQYSISASHPLTFAFGHGCPVIAPAVGTFQEDISDGVDGLLVPPGDPHALSEAMSRLLADDQLRMRIQAGTNLKHKARSWPRIAAMTKDIYLRAVS